MAMVSFDRLPPRRGSIKAQIMQEWGGSVASVASKAAEMLSGGGVVELSLMATVSFDSLPPKRGAIKAQIMQDWGGAVASFTKNAAEMLGGVAAFWRKRHPSG